MRMFSPYRVKRNISQFVHISSNVRFILIHCASCACQLQINEHDDDDDDDDV